MDVCLSKDNKVVVIHDPNLRRMCDIDKKVNEYNYDELPKIKEKFQLHFSDQTFDATQAEDRQFPLFDDVCRELGDTPINMELKTCGGNVSEEVYKILKKYNKLDQVVWGYVKHEYAMKLRKIDPNVARFASKKEVMQIIVGYFFGFLPFVSLSCDTLQVPIFNDGFKVTKYREITNPIKRNFYFGFLITTLWLGAALFKHLELRGIETIFWVINSEKELEHCLKYEGIAGIMTDCPQVIIDC